MIRMAAATGLTAKPAELARQLETIADLGLLGRLPSTTAEPVFNTVPEPHSHLVYEDEEPAQVIGLQVSPETLLAILRQALAERPKGVEVLVRFRRDPLSATDRAARAGGGRCRASPGRHPVPRLTILDDRREFCQNASQI